MRRFFSWCLFILILLSWKNSVRSTWHNDNLTIISIIVFRPILFLVVLFPHDLLVVIYCLWVHLVSGRFYAKFPVQFQEVVVFIICFSSAIVKRGFLFYVCNWGYLYIGFGIWLIICMHSGSPSLNRYRMHYAFLPWFHRLICCFMFCLIYCFTLINLNLCKFYVQDHQIWFHVDVIGSGVIKKKKGSLEVVHKLIEWGFNNPCLWDINIFI